MSRITFKKSHRPIVGCHHSKFQHPFQTRTPPGPTVEEWFISNLRPRTRIQAPSHLRNVNSTGAAKPLRSIRSPTAPSSGGPTRHSIMDYLRPREKRWRLAHYTVTAVDTARNESEPCPPAEAKIASPFTPIIRTGGGDSPQKPPESKTVYVFALDGRRVHAAAIGPAGVSEKTSASLFIRSCSGKARICLGAVAGMGQ